MMKMISILMLLCCLGGCASTTKEGAVGVDRPQLLLVPASQINNMSEEGYGQMKQESSKKGALNQDPKQVARVRAIMNRLIPPTSVFRDDSMGWKWEANVVTSSDLNAFCMPGGKIIVYTGIMEKLKLTDGELAAIMGHEIAHALREHGRERISEALPQQIALQAAVATGKLDPKYAAAAGAVSALLVTLPHGRNQETEADQIGLELMARAGFNPTEALSLWKKMESAGGGGPPEFLSTHPSSSRRFRELQALMPRVQPLYEASSKAPSPL